MKLLIQGVIVCLMLAVLLPSGIGSAQETVPNLSKMDAAQRERVRSTGRAPLVIDCKKMRRGTAKQRRLAKKHCERRDSRSQSVSGAISPTDTTVRHGNCGTTLIAVENVGGGTARIRAGAKSILGPILYGSYMIPWYNNNSDAGGALSGGIGAGGSLWSYANLVQSGPGTVLASLSGQVIVGEGILCTFLYPIASERIY